MSIVGPVENALVPRWCSPSFWRRKLEVASAGSILEVVVAHELGDNITVELVRVVGARCAAAVLISPLDQKL